MDEKNALGERREAAERMRVYAHDFDFGDSNPLFYVAKAAFGDVDAHTCCSVFARLADLIDPTCEVVCKIRNENIVPYIPSYWDLELSCGHWVESSPFELPRYCSECGARVIGGSDADR